MTRNEFVALAGITVLSFLFSWRLYCEKLPGWVAALRDPARLRFWAGLAGATLWLVMTLSYVLLYLKER